MKTEKTTKVPVSTSPRSVNCCLMLFDRLKNGIGKDPDISEEKRCEEERTYKEKKSTDCELDSSLLLSESH